MATIHIGTSGYSYSDWVGPVYPEGTPSSRFLELYARELDFVELNFSYYAMPRAEQLARMAERTPAGFCFAIKAHKTMTHEREPETALRDARSFREAVAVLQDGGRLAAVLVQFPYSFHYEVDSRRYLDSLIGALEGLPLAVEFRNREWQRDSVREGLAKREVATVNVDQPDLPGLMEPESTVTAPLAYLRLHGRNKENWWEGDNTSRYDYLYSKQELEGWVGRIKGILRKARTLLVAFNNHYRGQAWQNATMLRGLLEDDMSA